MKGAPAGFGRRLVLILLVAAPLAYASRLVAAVVHESLGHGVASVLCGGTFPRVVIKTNGDGGALFGSGGLKRHKLVVLAAGVVVEWIVGGAFAVAAWRSKRMFSRLICVVLVAALLGESGLHAFWGCIVPGPPTDFGRIAEILGGPRTATGAALATTTGVVWIVCDVAAVLLAFRWLEDVVGPLSKRRALALLACFVMFDASCRLAIVADQLTQALDFVPCVLAIALDACIFALLCEHPRAEVAAADVPNAAWRRAIFVSWTASAAVVTTILVAFRE